MTHWFTSDTHWNHKNIVRGTSSWGTKEEGSSHQNTRDFDTLEEHNAKLIRNFNSVIKHDDILYHLGDWSFGGFEAIEKFRHQLNCRTIHLIYGNHDHHIENNKENIQDLFASVSHYKEKSIDGTRICMSHYAMRVWNKSHHGSWMLYGHSHGTLPSGNYGNARTMDVGVDTNDLMPYSLEQLKLIMNKRPALLVDHHSKNTN